jgi:polar amino acid transport system substrate-binding protein
MSRRDRIGRAALSASLLCVFITACGIPRDPENTLERVTGGTLRVGYALSDPWVTSGDDGPSGIEAELIERFATEIDAQIEWTEGSESEVVEALEVGELDVVISGLGTTDPWSDQAAFTHPYVTTQVVVGIPEGDEIPEDIAGLEVAVESGTGEAGILERTDAIPVEVEDVAEAEGPVVVDDWLLQDLDLNDSGVTLEEIDHVMATRFGENGFLVELEGFLLDNPDLVARLLAEVQP